jgi:NADPH2:quinone reductase
VKAWTVGGVGAPADVMECVERDSPTPGPGLMRVKVRVAGVSLPEVLMCRDAYPYKPARPFTPGHEICGDVLDPGDCAGFRVGQRVMGVTAFFQGSGGHAEEALLLGSAASAVPASMSDEHAAIFTIAYQTAWIGLVSRAGLAPGETLLVHGAAGGTGFAAVQLGKAMGARVIAVARGESKAASCLQDGADHVVDTTRCDGGDWLAAVREAAGPGGVDVVFDPVGGAVFERSLECLAYGGRLLAIGFASGAWGEVPTRDLVSRNATVVGALAVPPDIETAQRMQRELADHYEQGRLAPRVTRVWEFSQVPEALTELDERRAVGKHVVRVSG